MNNPPQALPRLTPGDIRRASFPIVEKGGYYTSAVDHVITTAANQLDAAQAEILRLRAEAEQNGQGVKKDVSAETVNLLSRAQVIADRHVADAEQYAHDLIDTARKQYTEILHKAQERVHPQDTGEKHTNGGVQRVDYTTAIDDIEYVRTYTKVAQIQLRAVIDALAEQVDQLGQLPRLDPTPENPPTLGKPR